MQKSWSTTDSLAPDPSQTWRVVAFAKNTIESCAGSARGFLLLRFRPENRIPPAVLNFTTVSFSGFGSVPKTKSAAELATAQIERATYGSGEYQTVLSGIEKSRPSLDPSTSFAESVVTGRV